MFIYKKSESIVGGAYTNHALDVPTGEQDANKLRDIIHAFNDKNSGKNKAYEIKLATVVYKNVPDGHSPMLQLMAQPQTNSYSSYLNSIDSEIILKEQRILCGE